EVSRMMNRYGFPVLKRNRSVSSVQPGVPPASSRQRQKRQTMTIPGAKLEWVECRDRCDMASSSELDLGQLGGIVERQIGLRRRLPGLYFDHGGQSLLRQDGGAGSGGPRRRGRHRMVDLAERLLAVGPGVVDLAQIAGGIEDGQHRRDVDGL